MTPNSLFVAPSRVKSKTTAMVFTLLVIFTLILTACGGGTTQQATSKHILKIATQSYDFAQSGFNPYNGHPNAGILGLVYETLYFVNVNGGAFTPMLATNTVSGRWWYVKIGGEETSETGGSHAHQVSKGDPGE